MDVISLKTIDLQVYSWIKEVKGYVLLQRHSYFEARRLQKISSHRMISFTTLIPSANGLQKNIDLLWYPENKAYGVIGDCAIALPFSEYQAEIKRINQMENFGIDRFTLYSLFQQQTFSQETIAQLQLLREIVLQNDLVDSPENRYYQYYDQLNEERERKLTIQEPISCGVTFDKSRI